MPLTPTEQLLYATVKITGLKANAVCGTGSGFFYRVALSDTRGVVLIVTNKHVIEGCDEIAVVMHRDQNGSPVGWSNVVIELHDPVRFDHPSDNVDLVGIGLGTDELVKQGLTPFLVALDSSLIPSDEEWDDLDAVENVLMVGCPNGLYDEHNALPTFRSGITASHPAKRFNDKDEFMIDAACFPGSSGSPVFLFDQFGHLNKADGSYEIGRPRVKLLGVLYSGPTIAEDGSIILERRPRVSVNSMMHLGFVIRSSQVAELEGLVRSRLLPKVDGASTNTPA